jgi:serine/threonine protein kinase
MNPYENGRTNGRDESPAVSELPGPGPDDPRVIAALEEYLSALQGGRVPDRKAFEAQHADIAPVLAECLDGLEWMHGATRRSRAASAPVVARRDAGLEEGTSLGDYRIVREVGRGGMGVVYEAVQESLGRQVALKVLAGHALLAPEPLERFRREARAAALLHHSNIVPVFGVGQDRGVYFYAMQFIHGQSLDRVLEELRRQRLAAAAPSGPETLSCRTVDGAAELSGTLADRLRTGRILPVGDNGSATNSGERMIPRPAGPPDARANQPPEATGSSLPERHGEYFRAVAWIGVQTADALAYAHRQGILHRDVKPANLMLDGQGTVWVTDFGLAKEEGSGALTGARDVVGTLRYLAPERFDGCSCPGSDIYSLGTTLYELLTLRPAFDEPDRARLIERVTRGTAPVPRQLDGRIPRDLETIVLKAMAREPGDRYVTAEALAEDLRRFLADRPIRARRAGPAERAWRWCRRNRAVAVLLAASLALTAGLAGLAVLLWEKQHQTAAALQQVDQQRCEADRRRLIAESNFHRARVLLDNATLRQRLAWMGKPGTRQSLQTALKKALALYPSLVTEPGPDPGDRLLTAQMHMELGNMYLHLDQHGKAAREYRQAIAYLRPLAAEFPQEAGFRDSLAHCFMHLAWQVGAKGGAQDPAHRQEAEENYAQAISFYEALRLEFRDAAWYRQQLADCWNHLGDMRRRGGRFREAEDPLRRALALQERLFEEFPQRGDVRADLIQDHNDLAWALATRPDWQPQHAAQALKHALKAVDLQPEFHDWWHTLGVAHCRLGHWNEALAAIKKSRELSGKPGPPDSWDRFFEAMAYWGLGDKASARRCYYEGVQWMQKHLPDHPDLGRFRDEAAYMLGIPR